MNAFSLSSKARLRFVLSSSIVIATAGACSSKSDDRGTEGAETRIPFDCPSLPPDGAHHVVLVQDTGFDLSLPVFRGKVAGCYSLVCDGPTTSVTGRTDDEYKKAYIDDLRLKDASCRLAPGISLRKSSSFDAIRGSREAWNDRVRAKTSPVSVPKGDDIERVITGEDSFNYHGTAVASLIAYQNPNVRIVFVNNEGILRSDSKPTCPSVSQMRKSIDLLRDPQVRQASIAAPTSTFTDDLVKVLRGHGVTFINESFGARATKQLEADCPGLPWAELQRARSEISVERTKTTIAKAYEGIRVLTARAAGNSAAVVDSSADVANCYAPTAPSRGADSADVMVGSYAWSGAPRISRFSNRGACVDLYAPGELILTQLPEGYLYPVSGTSFSSPLTVRFLSMTTPPTAAPNELKKALLARVDQSSRFLPVDLFDRQLLFSSSAPALVEFRSLRSVAGALDVLESGPSWSTRQPRPSLE